MSVYLFIKISLIWCIIAIFAVANGVFRVSFLELYIGKTLALPVSGITLSIIVFTITFLSFKLFDKSSSLTYLLIGIQWVSMTLAFEFIFGHFVMGISWLELFQVFNILEGNLFIIALLVTLFSPLLVSLIRKEN